MTPCRPKPPSPAVLALLLAACLTTPLPLPPSVDPDRVRAEESDGPTVLVRGGPGAVDEGGLDLRVTAVPEPSWGSPPEHGLTRTADDGSFAVEVPGQVEDTFYFEALLEDRDLFLVALRLEGGALAEADPGPDRDRDGSPDAIDCAPDDPAAGGRRCE